MSTTVTTDQFTDKAANALPPLLEEGDPAPYTIIEKLDSPIIYAWPHNGYNVPRLCYDENNKPLGLSSSCFDPNSPERRHEACDWEGENLRKLFINTEEGKKHSSLSANYSRLIVDLNRVTENDHHITQYSGEDPDWAIPGNLNLSEEEKKQRFDEIYNPYVETQNSLIEKIKQKYGGVIFLEIHTFTPVFQGKHRETEMGTLTFDNNPVEAALINFWRESGLNGRSNYPYDTKRDKPAYRLSETHGVYYTGIEIRNDCLQSDPQRFALMMQNFANHLQSHPNFESFLSRENNLYPAPQLEA